MRYPQGAGCDNLFYRNQLQARKRLEKRADSPQSGARSVRQHGLTEPLSDTENAEVRGSKHSGQMDLAKPIANIMTRLRAGDHNLFVTFLTRATQPSNPLRSKATDEQNNPTQNKIDMFKTSTRNVHH